MRRSFVSIELFVAITIIGILVAICLPIVAAIRSSRLSPALGIALIAAVCLLFLVPWALLERAGRRRMKELLSKRDEPEDENSSNSE